MFDHSGAADYAAVLQHAWTRTDSVQQGSGASAHLLGSVLYGGRGASGAADVHVPLDAAEGATWRECWYSPVPVKKVQDGPLLARHNPHVMWGCFSLPVLPGQSCAAAVRQHYLHLLHFLQQTGFVHLWRIWNFIPHINALDEHGQETYRAFNQGRAAAFEQIFDNGGRAMPGATRHMPAATGVGCQSNELHVCFLAGRQPGRHIENPRQQPAYHYPEEYGPRPPGFARASCVDVQGHPMLFVSGTASIIGHQTVHTGNLKDQCCTAVENLRIVAARTGRSLQQLTHFKVYVRHPRDLPAVKMLLPPMLGVSPDALACFVAETCRQNLLMEIEGMQI